MAVTIVRTNWIDDDGTGTTGTVINNAVKTDLYNQIDGALAKVASLAGGNAFTGGQVIYGALWVNTSTGTNGQIEVVTDPTHNGINLQNSSTTTHTLSFLGFFNGSHGVAGYIGQNGVTAVVYVTTSDGRLKDDAGPATDLTALRDVLVHDFIWKADGVPDRGVFAQEAHALYPRAVFAGTDDRTEDGSLARPWGTDYSKFVPDLIVGWQQHDAALADLRAELATLKGSPDAQ